MYAIPTNGVFQSASQRVASTYLRMLSEFCPVFPAGLVPVQQAEMQAEQADLHGFFQALYDALYKAPDQFGLPAAADIYLKVGHSQEDPDKGEVKRALDRPRKQVEDGINFLSLFACQANLMNNELVLAPDSDAMVFLKKKPGRTWVHGMEIAGLIFTQNGDTVGAANERFPQMMPALKALAEGCAGFPGPGLGGVFFARCDFRSLLQEFKVAALDLYRAFDPASFAWAYQLHAYFTGRGYQEMVECGRLFNWVVKYQGKKSIKATPLFQMGFDDRYQLPMRVQIKCASAQRIAPLLPGQSLALQEDFNRRAFNCGNCHWCDNQKTLGPYEFEFHGETRKVCWYVLPDLDEFSEETASLVKEYEQMHEGLG
jgi:hypothetical protein